MTRPVRLALLLFITALVWLPISTHVPSGRSALASSAVTAKSAGTIWLRLAARCEELAREPLPPYPWPIAPFHQEHPVRGYFGDPRTVFSGKGEAALSFHNGIDISAWRGNRVYPVVSGTVIDVDGDRVIVQATARRRFQYIHIWPLVRVGESVFASRTVLGIVPERWSHVHLTEIRSGCAVNPLAPGHLTPFTDRTRPRITTIRFVDSAGRAIDPASLAGNVRLIVNAQDEPALPAPGQWQEMPVTPALLTWQLATLRGSILLRGIGADFRYSEPPAGDFCSVYALGTVQNFAAVAGVYRWAQPGRFLFDLTPRPIDTSQLEAGPYLVTVTASNLGGHVATRTVRVAIRERGLLRLKPARRDRRCG